jgi:hypothetical protein
MQRNTLLMVGEKWMWNPLFVAVAVIVIESLTLTSEPSSFYPTVLVRGTVLNAIAFWVGYWLLKPFKTLVFWKFAIYLLVLTGINWFFFKMRIWDWSLFLVGGDYSWFWSQTLPFLASILLNIGFLKYLFQVDTRTAILMGTLIGMVDAESLIVSVPIRMG